MLSTSASPANTVARLNCGCGPKPVPGWINHDWRAYEGVSLHGDIRDGLALEDATVDYAVAMHFLQDLLWADVPIALRELRRVLKPGGALRLGLPDLDRAIDAYRRGDAAYFHVPDSDAESVAAKFITQIIWYGSVFTPFTFECAREWLHKAGFRDVRRCGFRETHSPHAEIVSLDNRERESFYVEALA
jgi:predicted SAM-dependent methyltransferase